MPLNPMDILKRVCKYGPSGVCLWLRIQRDVWREKRFFRRNAKRHPLAPAAGVTLVGDMTGTYSLSKTLRDLAHALHAADVPLQVYCPGAVADPSGSGVLALLTPKDAFRTRRYKLALDMFNGLEAPDGFGLDRATIAFWEYPDGFRAVYPELARRRHVIGMSDFVVDVLRRELPPSVRVSKLLYPFHLPCPAATPRDEIRRRFALPADAFAVFFNFDFGSGYGRKNPDGAVRAFARAFADDPGAVLVFKTMRAKDHPDKVDALRRLAAESGVADRLRMISDYLSEADLYGLARACDVYLSLHRGEGFGLGVAEALASGVPAVVSDCGGTTEFCNADNSVPVPCRETPSARQDHLTYAHVTRWFEPDLDAAAEGLRRLRKDEALRRRLGENARRFMADYFSTAHFRQSVDALLAETP